MICLALIMLCCATTLGGYELSLKKRLISLSLITASCFGLTNYMSITLFQVWNTIEPIEYVSIPCSFFLGILVSRAILLNLLLTKPGFCGFVCKVLMFWDYEMFETILEKERTEASSTYSAVKSESFV